MSPLPIVSVRGTLQVTPEGHAAALTEQSCECRWVIRAGMLVCEYCETGVQLTRPQAARLNHKGAN